MPGFVDAFLHHPLFLMEGALGTRLAGEYSLATDPDVALAAHVYGAEGRSALGEIWGGYAAVAHRRGLPFLANTPTRRANRERAALSRYGEAIIRDNVAFLRSLAEGYEAESYVGGTIGCKGNAYTGEGALGENEAREFHAWTVERFARAGADYLFAGIMPALPEAIGLARACSAVDVPYIISFMITAAGRLVDGTPIADAILAIDGATAKPPLCYATNCVHPAAAASALAAPWNDSASVRRRFQGIMANASPLSPEELDGTDSVRQSSPAELADSLRRMSERMNIRIVGGCCGTDETYLDALAACCIQSASDGRKS